MPPTDNARSSGFTMSPELGLINSYEHEQYKYALLCPIKILETGEAVKIILNEPQSKLV